MEFDNTFTSDLCSAEQVARIEVANLGSCETDCLRREGYERWNLYADEDPQSEA